MKRALLLLLGLILVTSTLNGQVAIIANKDVPVENISKTKLIDLYTRDIRMWSDQLDVKVFDLELKNDTKRVFYKFIGKSSSRMKSIWLRKKLAGECEPPRFVESEAVMLQCVAETQGAVGFIPVEKVTSDVKILLIVPTYGE